MTRTDRDYLTRRSLRTTVTAREIVSSIGYNTPATLAMASFTVNRTRAERQLTANGITLARILSANLSHRIFDRLTIVGQGNATLTSYRYDFDVEPTEPDRTFSRDDRDVASAFATIGARFAVTPRCSTTANFSYSRAHNVALDAELSSGNAATSVYQINGALRMPLTNGISISQDYIISAAFREFDYEPDRDDLARTIRIDTVVADTLSRLAYVRLDHRYQFTDQGEFTPSSPGGPRLYGVRTESHLQTMDGTIGIRPVPGIVLVAKQSLAQSQNRDLAGKTRSDTDQWNLSLGLEVNRTFWGGAGLTGAVRRESRYQIVTNRTGPQNELDQWLVAVTFQKDF
jgi:hypothetical protein